MQPQGRQRALATMPHPSAERDQPMTCHIRIKGHLSSRWTDWFEGMAITLEDDGATLLTGPVVDQAALHGVLRKLRDVGLPLLSITCTAPERDDLAHVQ